MSEYIQIGVTALRDPVTGDYLPAVPLYIREDDRGKVHAPIPSEDSELGKTLAGLMRQYMDGCKAAGIEI